MITFNKMALKMRGISSPGRSIRLLWALLAIICFLSENSHGQQWTSRNSGISADLDGVAYGNNMFVAVGEASTVLTSSDGMTWSHRAVETKLSAVTYGTDRFIAIGGSGMATSTDGITWTTHTLPVGQAFAGIAYGAGTFVALNVFGEVATSPDGSVWTPRNTGSSGILGGIVYARNQFVTVGTPGAVLTSPDGVKWAAQKSGTSEELFSVAYGNNHYVAVGKYGIIIVSPDGTNWTTGGLDVGDSLNGVTYGNNEFVAVGVDEFSPGHPGSILTSPDGITWTNVNAPADLELSGVAYGANQFVAVGLQGKILQSGTPSVQPPTLGPLSALPSGAVEVTVTGVAGQTYGIQFSNNLKDWSDLTNVTLTNSVGSFTNLSAPNDKQRFYRGLAKLNFLLRTTR
jgi:hypothetical protein